MLSSKIMRDPCESHVRIICRVTNSCVSVVPSIVCGNLLTQLIASGATRQQGIVKKVTHEYGFLQSLSGPESVYFNTCHVVQGPEGGERLRPGSQVMHAFVSDIALAITRQM